jgi:hypothetical protein
MKATINSFNDYFFLEVFHSYKVYKFFPSLAEPFFMFKDLSYLGYFYISLPIKTIKLFKIL